ncbi:MAG: hypothetical protein WCS15_10260 [Prevotella sp.]
MVDHKDTLLTKFRINGTEIKGLDLDSVPVPDGDSDSHKRTTQSNLYIHKKALGMYDPGECEISGIYIPGDPGQATLDTAFRNRTECTFQVDMTESGTIFQYTGNVTKFLPESDRNTARFTAKILATGLFESSASYAAISKVEATNGVVTPGTAASSLDGVNTIIIYGAPGEASDSIKVTAADADSISYTLDESKTWVPLSSGVLSGEISIGSTGITAILLKVEETDKATRFVNMYLTNTAWDKLNTSSESIVIEKQLIAPPELNFGFTLPNFYIGSDGVNPPEFYSDCDLESLKPTGKTYYVDVTNGSSSNDGLTADTPLGLIEDAIKKPDVDVIVLAPGVYSHVTSGNGYWIAGSAVLPHNMSIICPNGRAVISQRQSFSSGTWATVDGKPHTYRILRTNTGRVFDSSVLDSHGDYSEMTHVTSIDAVEATAHSWYMDESSNVYVHTSDDRIPGEEIYLFFKVLYGIPVSNTYTYYLENIDIEGGSSPFRLSHGNLYAKNCTFKYGTDSNGVSLWGSNAILMNCTAANNALDGFNYHISSFGWLCNAVEIDCIGRDNGGITWINSNKIDNGSTAHEGCKVVRLNGQYMRNYGPNCIDITTAKSWNINCVTTDTKLGSDTSSANAGFECLSDAVMWLDSCTATGTYYTTYVESDNGAEMYYTNSRILFYGI